MPGKSNTQKLSALIYNSVMRLGDKIEFSQDPALSMKSLGDGFYRININCICRFKSKDEPKEQGPGGTWP